MHYTQRIAVLLGAAPRVVASQTCATLVNCLPFPNLQLAEARKAAAEAAGIAAPPLATQVRARVRVPCAFPVRTGAA